MTDVSYSVVASADDGKCGKTTGTYFNNTANWIGFGDDSGVSGYHNWIRFDNVTIPQGVNIESCILRCIARDSRSGTTVNVTIHLEDADDPLAPSSGADAVGRSLTTGVEWNNLPSWTVGNSYDSVDFSSELQTVIDRGGWSSGQALIVNVLDNGSTAYQVRTASSYNHSTYDPPELVVTYSDVGDVVDSFTIADTIDAELPDIGYIEGSFTVQDVVDALQTDSPILDSFTVTDTIDAGFVADSAVVDAFEISDTVGGYKEAEAAFSDSFECNDIIDAFNYSAWLRAYEIKAQQRFFLTLTGAADGQSDVELPASSIYATRASGQPSYLQVVIPSFNYALDISLRPNGELIIEIGYNIDGVINEDLREQLMIVDMDSISSYEGGKNRSITLAGKRTVIYGSNLITIDEATVIYRAIDLRSRIFRFNRIHPFVNPGDTIVIRDYTEDDAQEAFTCNRVLYSISEYNSTMELSETL